MKTGTWTHEGQRVLFVVDAHGQPASIIACEGDAAKLEVDNYPHIGDSSLDGALTHQWGRLEGHYCHLNPQPPGLYVWEGTIEFSTYAIGDYGGGPYEGDVNAWGDARPATIDDLQSFGLEIATPETQP